MYIPITRVFNDTTAWVARHFPYGQKPTSLNYRQEAIAPPPPPTNQVTTAVVLTTSTKIIRPSNTDSDTHKSVLPSKTSSLPISTTQTSTETLPSTTPERPDSTESTATSREPLSSLLATSSLSATASNSILPTNTSSPHFTANEGKHIGLIVGIVVGSIFGAILLGLLVYWLYACYRGINVCCCFGGTNDKDDHDTIRTPALQQPYPMSGMGAAPRIDTISRPVLSMPGTTFDQGPRLQRKYAPNSVSQPLGTIVER